MSESYYEFLERQGKPLPQRIVHPVPPMDDETVQRIRAAIDATSYEVIEHEQCEATECACSGDYCDGAPITAP